MNKKTTRICRTRITRTRLTALQAVQRATSQAEQEVLPLLPPCPSPRVGNAPSLSTGLLTANKVVAGSRAAWMYREEGDKAAPTPCLRGFGQRCPKSA